LRAPIYIYIYIHTLLKSCCDVMLFQM